MPKNVDDFSEEMQGGVRYVDERDKTTGDFKHSLRERVETRKAEGGYFVHPDFSEHIRPFALIANSLREGRRTLEQQADALLADPDELVLQSEDALDQPGNSQLDAMSDDELELVTYWQCPGCDFPHTSEQKAVN